MISISEEVTIPSPPAAVWPMLRDPALVASCIPGATLTQSGEGGAYQGTMRVKFGPTIAIFRGEAKLAYDDTARRCTIEGRGIDGRGASRALASGVVTARGDADTTVLKVEGNFNVTGPLETFANAGGVHLARAILAEFAGNMAKLAQERPAPIPEEAEPANSSLGNRGCTGQCRGANSRSAGRHRPAARRRAVVASLARLAANNSFQSKGKTG